MVESFLTRRLYQQWYFFQNKTDIIFRTCIRDQHEVAETLHC